MRQKKVGEHQIENENPRRTRGSFHLSVRAPFIFFYFLCLLCNLRCLRVSYCVEEIVKYRKDNVWVWSKMVS